ncbi:MAG: glutathione peroxidase [Proteobacteria bacterium]|nr:MAG: glutathione peroxidase [Pseudomonadota bacterium]
MPSLHDFQARAIGGEERSLREFAGKAALVVNVASKCGLTPQYAGLQKLYETYRARGFEVLGFPCNQFAGQEPGSDAEVQQFCERSFGVGFPLFSKIDVNGPQQHPLYAWLTSLDAQPEGAGDVKWNFGKFVVGRDGAVVARFAPPTAPDDPALVAAIEKALG